MDKTDIFLGFSFEKIKAQERQTGEKKGIWNLMFGLLNPKTALPLIWDK